MNESMMEEVLKDASSLSTKINTEILNESEKNTQQKTTNKPKLSNTQVSKDK